MKTNFHTHTTRCGHASGTDEDYVRAALAQGFGVLGFSDHVPWPYRSGFHHPGVRMDVSDLPDYERSIRALAKQYEGKLTVALGFECEYFPEYMGWLQDMAAAHNLDYLILGNHYDETDETGIYFGNTRTVQQLTRYVEMTIRGLRTGLFTYLAHPDLFMRRWPHGFTEDCRRAALSALRERVFGGSAAGLVSALLEDEAAGTEADAAHPLKLKWESGQEIAPETILVHE